MTSTPLETIQKGNSSVTVAPARGGTITSIRLSDIEILYLDQETFDDPARNVRGGIPIMYPNSGVIESSLFPGLKNHGFARLSDTWVFKKSSDESSFTEMLDTAPSEQFPFASRLTMRVECIGDASVRITQTATNSGAHPMPISMGLHPYFKVPVSKKPDIRFVFPGGEIIEQEKNTWMNGGTVFIDNPTVADESAVLSVKMPDIGTLEFKVSSAYRRIWVWSLPEKDFICIEPAMRDQGGLVNDPAMVSPGSSISADLTISLSDL